MKRTWGWVAAGVGVVGVAMLLARPAPEGHWPEPTPSTHQAQAAQLAQAVETALARARPDQAFLAAQVLSQGFASTPQARSLAPRMDQLAEQARRHGARGKWQYHVMGEAGWGHLAQAQIQSEPSGFHPAAPPSILVVRHASDPRHRAAFFVAGAPLSPDCHLPGGCVLQVAAGATATQHRIVPLADRPGWWMFTDYPGLFSLLGQGYPVRMSVRNVPGSAVEFDAGHLDLARMGAAARP